jgi:hypothetical protein
MIIDELQHIVLQSKQNKLSDLYIRSLLKEYLQVYILNFIYTHKKYSSTFIFTGGTCLRHCFNLNRLSEDLDFDITEQIDTALVTKEIEKYFNITHLYTDIKIHLLQKGRQILCKFPVLHTLNLANESESDLLYVKVDITPISSDIYNTNTTLKSLYGFNYLVTHYDLPSLMSGKITAILTRNRMVGKENIPIVKGRDFFDLLWYLEQKIVPNLDRVNSILGTQYDFNQLVDILDQKVDQMIGSQRTYFKQDLIPFIANSQILDKYVDVYQTNYHLNKQYLIK